VGRPVQRRWSWVVALVATALHADAKPSSSRAAPASGAEPILAALAEEPGDDARKAIAIGPDGQVYKPDGNGAWIRTLAVTTADRVASVGRADGIVVLAEGGVYRLADNGWSALRLAQKGKALMSTGDRAVAVVGRQVFALERTVNGEPAKLANAPAPVSLIGAGPRSVVIQTERGLLRQTGTSAAWKPLARPKRVLRLVDDHWALLDAGVAELDHGVTSPWPADFRVAAVTPLTSAGGRLELLAVGSTRRGIELVTFGGAPSQLGPTRRPPPAKPRMRGKGGTASPPPEVLVRALPVTAGELVTDDPQSVPVGVVADPSGRVVIAFRDGTLAVRERGTWTRARITEALPAGRPGAPPAQSP